MGNEFHALGFDCVGSSMIPSGPGYAVGAGLNGICSVEGSKLGETFVRGDDYVRPFPPPSLPYHYRD